MSGFEVSNDKGEIIVKDIDYKNLIINKDKLVQPLDSFVIRELTP